MNRIHKLALSAGLIWLALPMGPAAQTESEPAADDPGPPNFLLVVADDLGWSDVGALGGEIRTPTLDALAAEGTVLTDYYVAPTCSPTRAMLMTGVDNHLAGVGTMMHIRAPNQANRNYDAQLHDGVVTVSEVFKAQGYETFMSGKWHLSIDRDQEPQARGFDRSFTLIQGGASHFADSTPLGPLEIPRYLEDGREVTLPNDFYSSVSYTDKMLEYLAHRNPEAPFFAYLAYTAPHDPLQVPDDWLNRYAGAYDEGPDSVRTRRAERVRELGLFPQDAPLWQLPNFPAWLPTHRAPWAERTPEERARDARPMEIYAAMVELMDQQLGRVIKALQASGDLDNTLVLFFSDNGASAVAPLIYPGNTTEWLAENWRAPPEEPGRIGNFTIMGPEWATVSNTPWRLVKGSPGEGGVRSPFIARGPGIAAGRYASGLAHVMDLTPTLLDFSGAEAAVTDPIYEGKLRPQGHSLRPLLAGTGESSRQTVLIELFGARALRHGDWKVSWMDPPRGKGDWRLFDMANDPGETEDLSDRHPEVRDDLASRYAALQADYGIIHPEPTFNPSLRQTYGGECDWWCELRFRALEWLQ